MSGLTNRTTINNVAKAESAWAVEGAPTPDWVLTLAEACDRTSQTQVAAQVKRGSSTISQVLSNTYPGDLERLADEVTAALTSAAVECPELGELARSRCLEWQQLPWGASDSMRVRVYHACRNDCPHARQHLLRKADA